MLRLTEFCNYLFKL